LTVIVLLVAYATGIAMVHLIAPWDTTGCALALGLLLLAWLPLCRSRWAWLPVTTLLVVAGFMQASLALKPPASANHISRFAGTPALVIEGRILTVESRASGGYRLLTDVQQVIKNAKSASITGKLLLYIKQGELKARPGQIVRWRASLRKPSRFGNPGEFDYPLHLAAQGIHVTSFLNRAEDLAVLANSSAAEGAHLENWRLSLATHIKSSVPDKAAGFLQSLLLGLKGEISADQRQVLSSSGVAHLFAISGLHFGLLALLFYQFGKWLYTRSQSLILWCPPQRVIPIMLIIPLAAYLFLTGNAWATRRAFLMATIIALLFAKGRRTPPALILATVAFFILLCNPLALFQPGFQLSFAGVAGILAWLPDWQRRTSGYAKVIRWPLTLIMTTVAATLATAPASLWHFHQFTPAGLLTNLFAIPLIAWGAVPLGMLSLAVLPLNAFLGETGLVLSAQLVTLAIKIVTSISQWPGLTAIPCYLTLSSLILLTGLLMICLPFGRQRSHWLTRLALLVVTVTAAGITQPPIADFQVTAISVGQGDATLVSLAGAHYLVDGGGLPGSSIDPGEHLVGPALGRMGISKLAGIILTHNHPDHTSGLTYIVQRFPVAKLYLAADVNSLAPELRQALHDKRVPIERIAQGWTHLISNKQRSLSLFAPSQTSHDKNERSIAVFAGDQNQGALLTADLFGEGLSQLVNAGLPSRATLLKLSHHGSRHADPLLYLKWLKPSVAFVSAGRNNPYGFPHQQTLEACNKQEVAVFRTDQQGMLRFRVNKNSWQILTGKRVTKFTGKILAGIIIDSFQGVW
jgi:competence protein ComEC